MYQLSSRHHSTKVRAPYPLLYPHVPHLYPPRRIIPMKIPFHFTILSPTVHLCSKVMSHTFDHSYTTTHSFAVIIISIHAAHTPRSKHAHRQTMPSFPARADTELGTHGVLDTNHRFRNSHHSTKVWASQPLLYPHVPH